MGREQVFRDRRLLIPLIGTLFGGAAAFMLWVSLPEVITKGGLDIKVNGRPDFWPNPWGALFMVAFSLPFFTVGALGWMYWLNNKIAASEQGLRSVNLFGVEDFIAAWPMVETVREIRTNNTAVMRIKAGGNELNVATTHPCCGQILALVRHHTQPPGSDGKLRVVPRPDRPDRVFRYGFPYQTLLATLPMFFMGGVAVNWGVLDDGDAFGYVFVGLLFGGGLMLILATSVSAVNGKVYVGRDRLIVVNGLGKVVFDVAWEDVTGVYYEGDSSTRGRGVNPLGFYRTYRIEAGELTCKVRSSMKAFPGLLQELKARLPAEVVYFEQ